jgi:hypothetical protein
LFFVNAESLPSIYHGIRLLFLEMAGLLRSSTENCIDYALCRTVEIVAWINKSSAVKPEDCSGYRISHLFLPAGQISTAIINYYGFFYYYIMKATMAICGILDT